MPTDGSRSEQPPVVIDGTTGDVLPQGNDLKSSQINQVAEETVARMDDATKLAVQRQALNTGFNQVQDTAKSSRETDQAYMTSLAQPAAPKAEMPQKFSIWKPSTWFK